MAGRRPIVILFVMALLLASPPPGFAPSNSISVSGTATMPSINTAVAGSQPTAVTNSSTTYTITTGSGQLKTITGSATGIPANVTLQIQLGLPSGCATATSAGTVTLTTTAQTLLSNICTGLSGKSGTITYTASATVQAAITTSTVTVTLTIA